jgi:type II secretory pathway component PulF
MAGVENFDPKLGESELRDFFVQFQVLLGAGVPVVMALDSLSKSSSPRTSYVAEHLSLEIRSGHYISSAMSRFPRSFDPLSISTVRVGEKSGRLTVSMRRLAEIYEWRLRVRRQMVEALAYPVCVLVLSLTLVLFLSGYMLPRILPLLTSLDVPLPAPTRLLLFLTQQQWILAVPLAGILLFLADRAWGNEDRQESMKQWILYSSPMLGRINRTRSMSRLCSELAMLTEVGLSLFDGLRTQSLVAPDHRLRGALDDAYRRVVRGEEVGPAVQAQSYLYPIVHSALTTGLETGRLPRSLNAASKLLDVEADSSTERLLQTLEPLVMLILGVVVGGMLLACFLPIYSLISSGL